MLVPIVSCVFHFCSFTPLTPPPQASGLAHGSLLWSSSSHGASQTFEFISVYSEWCSSLSIIYKWFPSYFYLAFSFLGLLRLWFRGWWYFWFNKVICMKGGRKSNFDACINEFCKGFVCGFFVNRSTAMSSDGICGTRITGNSWENWFSGSCWQDLGSFLFLLFLAFINYNLIFLGRV